MARRILHHQTPRFLLRRFATGELIEMRHRTEATRPVGTRDAAAQKHFYSYINEDGTRSVDVEDHLSEHVENVAAPIVRSLAAGTGPVQPDALALARFWAFQIVRSPRFREIDRQAAAQIGPMLAGFDAVSAVFDGDNGAKWDEEAAIELHAAAAADASEEYLAAPTTNSEIRIMLRWVDDLEAKLASLTWAVAEADRPVFCTSDNPVVMFRPTKDLAGFHGISPDTEAEVRVALDPTHVLLGTAHGFGPDRFPATKQLIVDTNRSTARECQNAIFYLPGTIPAGDLQLAPQPPRLPTPRIAMRPNPGGGTTDTAYPAQRDERLAAIIDATLAGDRSSS